MGRREPSPNRPCTHPDLRNVKHSVCMDMVGQQICRPGFGELDESARPIMNAAGGGALCLYLDGEPVLDMWSGHRDPEAGLAWEHDTMAMAWSTTKGVASTAVHMLADRGLVDYDRLVADYWPEFAANGKQATTIRQVLAMEAGLYDIRHLIDDPRQLLDYDAMVRALAAARPAHPPGTANGYHAITYGWLVGEIVRRITGHRLGPFLEQNVAEPLALDGFFVGTPDDELDRVAARPVLRPEPAPVRRMARLADPLVRPTGFSPARTAAAFLPRHGHRVMAADEFLAAEVASANGVFTARSLARFYAALGSDDGLQGVRLWSAETRRAVAVCQNRRRDRVLGLTMGWLLGYHRPMPAKGSSGESFGFYGAYGSGAYADPARNLAVGFVVQAARGMPLMRLVPAINTIVDRHRAKHGR